MLKTNTLIADEGLFLFKKKSNIVPDNSLLNRETAKKLIDNIAKKFD
jgi:hypothetical protein